MRAVFDTNIVLSALIFGGRLAWLRGAWVSARLVPVVCRQTTEELLRVLAYPKFRLNGADRAVLLQDYLPYAEIVLLPPKLPALSISCRDPDDKVFLHLAIAAHAPLISGDADLLDLQGAAPVEMRSLAKLREHLVPGLRT